MLDFGYLLKLNKKILKILLRAIPERLVSKTYYLNKNRDLVLKQIFQTDFKYNRKDLFCRMPYARKAKYARAYLIRLKYVEYLIRKDYDYMLTKKQNKKLQPLLKEVNRLYSIFK